AGRAGAVRAEAALTTTPQAAREGVLVALSNPKLILFFVALLSQFVSPEMSPAAKAIIVLTAMIIDGAWYVLVALMLSHSRVLPWLQQHAHWINRATGVMLLALALRVLLGPWV
ncbi:LysE family translocator, partial [Vreelandella massiliensis]|uniref:LysE family translocator n=1 Tax=Vreelandella massiliensis TaxID=1816686 RepID=UPI0013564CF6